MSTTIPDGVPEDFDTSRPDPFPISHGLFGPQTEAPPPTDEDIKAASALYRKVYDALAATNLPNVSHEAVMFVQDRAERAAAARFMADIYKLGRAGPLGIPSHMGKFADALLKDASDEEIIALAKQARKQLKEQADADAWRDGKKPE